jgi:hypothetical protein
LRSLGLVISIIISDRKKTNQNLDQPDILKGVGIAIEFGYRSMFHHSTVQSDCTNVELPVMTVLENRAADCCCARFRNRMVDYAPDNAARTRGGA